MCGLAGLIHLDGRRAADPAVLEAMNATLVHRGPDGEGVLISGPVGLASRRLAIVDLHPRGNQPISNAAGNCHIVANCEIYNYAEHRPALEKDGYRFKSHTDTEVILALYERHGERCVDYLRGMFAFAIWDERESKLFVARDRFGQKPLYYAQHDDTVWFASEIKALLADPALPRDTNPVALHRFLAFGYIPAPDTAFKYIRKLLPAHTLVVEDGRVRIERYWRLDYSITHAPAKLADLEREVLDRLEESVRLRLMGDVPVGTFLSGGVDSNAVTALMCRADPERVNSFSVGFRNMPGDESRMAREAAQYYGTRHHEVMVDPQLCDVLPAIVRQYDEPFGDPSSVPLWHLNREAARHITVSLNGEGADEMFAGYVRHRKHELARYCYALPRPLRRSWAGLLRGLGANRLGRGHLLRRLLVFLELDEPSLERVYGQWAAFHFNDGLAGELCNPAFLACQVAADPWGILEGLFEEAGTDDPINAMLSVDAASFLTHLLVKVDMMSMAHSTEARSPFLDHEFAGFVASLPGKLKLKGATSKWILKRALRGVVAPGVLNRRKMPFTLPVNAWLRGELSDMLRDVLLDERTAQRGYFRLEALKRLIDAHLRNEGDHGYTLWNLLVLELWHREVLDGSVSPAA
ncbi:MAG: asparagine synthase (glutamine-hydrolyzing) [Gammaproteobacteria bacterium]|nr:MAG: asparagine synthase (glutamine-hydrolyzing) [Gammaproteobacteria bacterium]